jgi:hypothetical protein
VDPDLRLDRQASPNSGRTGILFIGAEALYAYGLIGNPFDVDLIDALNADY